MATAARKLGPQWPTELSSIDMARQINVSVRHLRDLKKKGIVFEGSKPGTYQYPESLHGYIDYRRKLAAEAHTLSPLTIERGKTAAVNRQIAEFALADRQSESLTLEEADASWKLFATAIKQAALSLPALFKQALPHLSAHDERIFRIKVLAILDSLAREARGSVIGCDPDLLLPTDEERAGIKSRRQRT